jgi:hypothetical protein
MVFVEAGEEKRKTKCTLQLTALACGLMAEKYSGDPLGCFVLNVKEK